MDRAQGEVDRPRRTARRGDAKAREDDRSPDRSASQPEQSAERGHRQAAGLLDRVAFGLRLNIYAVGLMAMWNTINTLLLPERVEQTAPAALRNSALGLVGLVGIGLAAVIQPIAGRVSDELPLPDRRRPYVAIGTVGSLVALALFGPAPTFALLCLAYVLLQLAANIAQAAFQAFIPDLVSERERGLASGAKNVMTVLGAAIGLIGVRLLDAAGAGIGAELAFLGLLLALCAVLTYRWVPPVPPTGSAAGGGSRRQAAAPDDIWGWLRIVGPLLDPRSLWHAFAEVLHKYRVFRYAVLAQFLVLLGTYPAQRFLLFFLRDRFGGGAERTASVGLLAGIVLAALAAGVAGELSDRVGRLPVLRASVVLAAIGMAGVALAPTLPLVAVAGAPLAIGLGTFQAVNWALMSDEIPQGAGARFFGVANVATAGAGALAGLFGPLADALATVSPVAAYPITFLLAAVVALGGLWPLRKVAACGKRRPRSP